MPSGQLKCDRLTCFSGVGVKLNATSRLRMSVVIEFDGVETEHKRALKSHFKIICDFSVCKCSTAM